MSAGVMASIYNDAVSSRRGSSALPRCHSRFVLCSFSGLDRSPADARLVLGLLGTRTPCWQDAGQHGLAATGGSRTPPGVTGSGRAAPRGRARRHGTHGSYRCCFSAGGAWEGREEHACKVLARGDGGGRDLRAGRRWQGARGKELSHLGSSHLTNVREAMPSSYKPLSKLGLPSKQSGPWVNLPYVAT